MRWKNAVDDISPPPPVMDGGAPISPPDFPNKAPAGVSPQEPKSEEPKNQEPLPKPAKPPKGVEVPISEAVQQALEILKNIVLNNSENLEDNTTRIDNTETVVDELEGNMDTVITQLSDAIDIANSIKQMQVPERTVYESDQEYSDSLYNQIVTILDTEFSLTEGSFPEYQYSKSTITNFDTSGGILDGEITVLVTLTNYLSRIRYHFEIPVYVFGGYIQHPEVIIYSGKKYKFDDSTISEIMRYDMEEQSSGDFSLGMNWFDANKGTVMVQDPKIPGKPDQKRYDKYDSRLTPVEPRTRFWNNFQLVDENPDLNNLTSPAVTNGDIDYALY